MNTNQPFITEFAYLLMFTKPMTKTELFKVLYAESDIKSKRTIFNRLIKKLEFKIDKKLTKVKQLERNRSLIMNNYSFLIGEADEEINRLISRIKKANKAQIHQEIDILKLKKYEYTRRLKEVKKEREEIKQGKIIMRGYPIYYRASTKRMLNYLRISNQEDIEFFNELVQIPTIEYRLNQFHNELALYYHSRYVEKDSLYLHEPTDHNVDACRILTAFLKETLKKISELLLMNEHKLYEFERTKKEERLFDESFNFPRDTVIVEDFEISISTLNKWIKDYSYHTKEFIIKWHEKISEVNKHRPIEEKRIYNHFGVVQKFHNLDVRFANALEDSLTDLVNASSNYSSNL